MRRERRVHRAVGLDVRDAVAADLAYGAEPGGDTPSIPISAHTTAIALTPTLKTARS